WLVTPLSEAKRRVTSRRQRLLNSLKKQVHVCTYFTYQQLKKPNFLTIVFRFTKRKSQPKFVFTTYGFLMKTTLKKERLLNGILRLKPRKIVKDYGKPCSTTASMLSQPITRPIRSMRKRTYTPKRLRAVLLYSTLLWRC